MSAVMSRMASIDARWTLTASILSSSLAFLDYSMTNVTLPSLHEEFGGQTNDLQWTLNGYTLPLAALLLFGGALGDRFGRRRVLVAGLMIFGSASVGCALASSFGVLVPMRALQGVGAALLMPNSLALLSQAYPTEAQGRVIGTWAAFGMAASAAGPPLAGALILQFGWRGAFAINIPIAGIALTIIRFRVIEGPFRTFTLDWLGASLATFALTIFAYAVTVWSNHQISSVGLVTLLGLSACGILLLLADELNSGDKAMMPLSVFASKNFVGLSIVTFLVYAAYSGLLLFLPYVLIKSGYTPFQAGLTLLPIPAIIGILSRPFGKASAFVRPKWFLGTGSVITALGYLLFAHSGSSISYGRDILPAAIVTAIGMSGAAAPLTKAVLASVDPPHVGTASGFNSVASRSGGLIVTALAGTVLAQDGIGLTRAFHHAAFIGAAMAFAASFLAFGLID